MPVYNESKYVEEVLLAAQRYCSNILVVDDGSIDETQVHLQKFKSIQQIVHKENLGYGKSLIDIFNYAQQHCYEWVITMDCDCQHQPAFLPKFQQYINDSTADIISGSRYLSDISVQCVPKERLEINKYITALLNRNLGLQLTDAFCGFKAYRTNCLKKLNLRETGYGLPLELWIQATKQRLVIEEIPVPLIYHDPNRNFAGLLENSKIRMEYYLSIIKHNLLLYGYKINDQICCS